MKQQAVHYFPGHMQKALRKVESFISLVDIVIELVDARAPLSSRNPLRTGLNPSKPRLILLSKDDMADGEVTRLWVDYFRQSGIQCVSANLKKGKLLGLLSSSVDKAISAKREKEKRLGMKRQPAKAMVIGIPNVGKSTLINSLASRKAASVGNKAGITRAEQWIKLSEDFILLDTPGILPMNYPTPEQAVRLALLGSMREDVMPNDELSERLLSFLRSNYPNSLQNRFEIEDISSLPDEEILQSIAKRRGLLENGAPSSAKAAYLLLKEFKDGVLGRISLERPTDAE